MNNTNWEVVVIIDKLERYKQQGYMDRFEIGEIIQDIKAAYNKDNEIRLNKMMDDVTRYIYSASNEKHQFEDYVRENIEMIASELDKSSRTIYRKLQNDSFTLNEKATINRMIKQDAEH